MEAQREENRGLAQRNAVLAAEVDNLKSGEAAVEERARTELGMIRPGETFYRVVEGVSAEDAMGPQAPLSADTPPAGTAAAQ